MTSGWSWFPNSEEGHTISHTIVMNPTIVARRKISKNIAPINAISSSVT